MTTVSHSGAWLLSSADLNQIHDAAIAILDSPGMRIQSPRLRQALRQAGARVDEAAEVVRFPSKLIEDTLQGMRGDIEAGRRQIVLNGVVASKSPRAMGAKFGGACIEVYDWPTRSVRTPTRADLILFLQLGEALAEVAVVGNPVMYVREDDGSPVDPRLQRVKTAALVARHTTKAGSTEVWNARELRYLMELGEIVRGSHEAYLSRPCFVTAKETISPLVLETDAGEVLLLLAEAGLPCTIIPMPITGGSTPLTLASNIALGNAEILGTCAALRAACPTANCAGGVISGTLDMRTGGAVFSGPEAVLQDLGLAEVHERLYGFDFGIGGYIDAKLPGAQAAMEAMARFGSLARTGRYNVPVGLLNAGKRFSPEMALAGLEIERWIVESGKGIEVGPDTLRLEQVRKVGIAGHSMGEDHTREFMRKNIWYPQLMDRTLSSDPAQETAREMIETASRKVREILSRPDLYCAEGSMARAIDDVERSAARELTS